LLLEGGQPLRAPVSGDVADALLRTKENIEANAPAAANDARKIRRKSRR
jgi:hypothetical protein